MRALLIVDVQNDFCPGGALAVHEGDSIVPVINRLQPFFDFVVATQDWHPKNHLSFASMHPGKKPGDTIDLDGIHQVLWPDHCVQETDGAQFFNALDTHSFKAIIKKGTDARIDSYSAFFDNARRKATGLYELLVSQGIRDLTVTGLATDYCVKFSVLDALALGFKTVVITDAVRGVDLFPGDSKKALMEMKEKGASLQSSTGGIGELA